MIAADSLSPFLAEGQEMDRLWVTVTITLITEGQGEGLGNMQESREMNRATPMTQTKGRRREQGNVGYSVTTLCESTV